MAAIGFAFRLHPDLLWKNLSPHARKRVVEWLGLINRHPLVKNNWLFFRVLVNEGMAAVGAPHDAVQVERDLDELETFDLGGGWFRDGLAGGCDYYNGFAMHFYGLIYAAWSGDSARSGRIRSRAARFAEDFAWWFDTNGAAIPYGRSMVYRFAMAAFWSAAAYADLPVFTPGILRGLVMRNLRWWFQQPILDGSGLLTLGYAYPNLQMTEVYNSPGSPYWAGKTLLVLALPETHPFWQSPEEPLPTGPRTKVQANGRFLMVRSDSGHTALLNAGQSCAWNGRIFPSKYARFAYPSRFAFSVSLDESCLEAIAPDNSLWVSLDGRIWYGRGVSLIGPAT